MDVASCSEDFTTVACGEFARTTDFISTNEYYIARKRTNVSTQA